MTGTRDEPGVFDRACYRCDTTEDLVEDPRVEGLYVCRPCLDRVERQNRMIDAGLEEEPGVES